MTPFEEKINERMSSIIKSSPGIIGNDETVLETGDYFIISEDPAVKNFLYIDMNYFFELLEKAGQNFQEVSILFLSSATYPMNQLESVKENYFNLFGKFPVVKMFAEKGSIALAFENGDSYVNIGVEKKDLMKEQKDIKRIQFTWEAIFKLKEQDQTAIEEKKKEELITKNYLIDTTKDKVRTRSNGGGGLEQ